MLPKRFRILLVMALLPGLLACGLRRQTPSGEARVPVSREAADRFEEKLKMSFDEGGETFDLEITDAELTSFVVLELSELDRSDEVPVEDFQVRFTDGQMLVSGKVTTVCPFNLNVRATVSAQVEDGQLDLSVDKAQMGVVSMPKSFRQALSRIITETILESPERMEEAVQLTDVEIGEGVMRLGGRLIKRGE